VNVVERSWAAVFPHRHGNALTQIVLASRNVPVKIVNAFADIPAGNGPGARTGVQAGDPARPGRSQDNSATPVACLLGIA